MACVTVPALPVPSSFAARSQLGEMPPPLFEVRVLVERGARRRKQHGVAAAVRAPRARATALSIVPRALDGRDPGERRLDRARRLADRQDDARRAATTERSERSRSRRACRGRRGSGARSSPAEPSSDFGGRVHVRALGVVDPAHAARLARRARVRCGRPWKPVSAPAIAAGGDAEAVGRGDRGEGVLQVVRARERQPGRRKNGAPLPAAPPRRSRRPRATRRPAARRARENGTRRRARRGSPERDAGRRALTTAKSSARWCANSRSFAAAYSSKLA